MHGPLFKIFEAVDSRDYRIATEPRKNRENADVIIIIMHDALDQPWGQHSPAGDCAYIALLRLRFIFVPIRARAQTAGMAHISLFNAPNFISKASETLIKRLLLGGTLPPHGPLATDE
jgi:hypothetical protein